MDLWRTMEGFRVFEEASSSYLGAVEWVQRAYQYRHTIPNLLIAQAQLAEYPLHLQYLAGLHWFWDQVTFYPMRETLEEQLDPRVTRPEVREALVETAETLKEAFTAEPERQYELVRDVLNPVIQRLYEQAVEEQMQEQLMGQMAESGDLDLSDAQQQARQYMPW